MVAKSFHDFTLVEMYLNYLAHRDVFGYINTKTIIYLPFFLSFADLKSNKVENVQMSSMWFLFLLQLEEIGI